VEKQIIIYSPSSALQNPFRMLRGMLKDAHSAWDLAYILAKRDIKAQYRQSFLGYFWAFFTPLFNAFLWLFLQSSGIIQIADTGMPYAAYVLSGTLLWQIFTESVLMPLTQMTQFREMLAKLNFPKEAILINGIIKIFFTTIIKIIILFPVLLYFGVYPSWTIILFPVAVLSLIMVGTAIGLLMVPVGSLYSDVSRILAPILQLAMYVSPVIFALPPDGLVNTLFKLNFVTPLIITSRAWLSGMPADWLLYFGVVNLVGLVVLFLGWIIFRVTMPILVERMSA
jgi:lipopolysaccharide transport system permease protein